MVVGAEVNSPKGPLERGETIDTPAHNAYIPIGTGQRRRSGLPAFCRLLWRTLFTGKDSHGRLTPQRILVMGGFLGLLFSLGTIHWIGFLLDDIFFRGYRKIKVDKPLFIVGIPRSGTTFLHRLLSMDTENFTSMKLWELIFAPSITERKFWLTVARIDHALGGPGKELLIAFENKAFGIVRKIHRISFLEPEEDVIILTLVSASVFMIIPFPFPEELWHLVRFDTDTPLDDQKRIMAFYKRCVQRHLYVHGPEKRFLSKNPAFSPMIDAIDDCFPDAKIICTVRNPIQAVPSLINFLMYSWKLFDNDLRGNAFRDRILEIAGHWYRYPTKRLKSWPKNRHAILTYDVLTHDPEQAIENLYDQFGLQLGPAFEQRLRAEQQNALRYKSEHAYALDQFDLTPQQLLDDFADIFARFGFDAHDPNQSKPEEQTARAG